MSEVKYLVKLEGLLLKTGGEAEVGKVYSRDEFRASDFTFDRRLTQNWIGKVTQTPLVESTNEDQDIEEQESNSSAETEDFFADDDEEEVVAEEEDPGPLRDGRDIHEYWEYAETPDEFPDKRLCPICDEVIDSKSKLFDHCVDIEEK